MHKYMCNLCHFTHGLYAQVAEKKDVSKFGMPVQSHSGFGFKGIDSVAHVAFALNLGFGVWAGRLFAFAIWSVRHV